jgi:hypothetical protein
MSNDFLTVLVAHTTSCGLDGNRREIRGGAIAEAPNQVKHLSVFVSCALADTERILPRRGKEVLLDLFLP